MNGLVGWFALPPEVSAEVWRIVSGVMLTLSTAGVLGLVAWAWWVRDAVRDLIKEVGLDGRNGLRSAKIDHEKRIEVLEKWKIEEDRLADYEAEQARRAGRSPSRARDRLHGND